MIENEELFRPFHWQLSGSCQFFKSLVRAGHVNLLNHRDQGKQSYCGTAWMLMQIWFLRKWTLNWRLPGGVKVYRREQEETELRRENGLQLSSTKASAELTGSSETESCPQLEQKGWVFPSSASTHHWLWAALEKAAWSWTRQLSLRQGNSQRELRAESCQLITIPRADEISLDSTSQQYLQMPSQQVLGSKPELRWGQWEGSREWGLHWGEGSRRI